MVKYETVEFGGWNEAGVGPHCAECDQSFAGSHIDSSRSVDVLIRRIERRDGEVVRFQVDGDVTYVYTERTIGHGVGFYEIRPQ